MTRLKESTRAAYAKATKRGMRWVIWHHNMEKCARCGNARINVRHTLDRRNSIEGPEYYADIPVCEFQPSGGYVDGYNTVNGYIPLWRAERDVERSQAL